MKTEKVKVKEKTQSQDVSRRFRVTGRVQGVGFRKIIRNKANQLGLAGWVRNESDGSVLVELYGKEQEIEIFHLWLFAGIKEVMIFQVIEEPSDARLFYRFEIVS